MFFACVGFYLQPSIVYNPHGAMRRNRGIGQGGQSRKGCWRPGALTGRFLTASGACPSGFHETAVRLFLKATRTGPPIFDEDEHEDDDEIQRTEREEEV